MGGTQDVVRRPSRLRALATLDVNALSSADALDRIAGLACRVLGAHAALVNLVGADTQSFVACAGPAAWREVREMPVTHGFCPFTLGADDAFVVPDARKDPTFATDPVVTQFGVVAYAGVPLRAGVEPVGTLCAIDVRPHEWSPDDLSLLADLGASAIAELQLLAANARQRARVRALADLSRELAPATGPQDVVERLQPVVRQLDATALWLAVGESVAGTPPERIPPAPEQPEFVSSRAGSLALLPLGEHQGVLGVSFADEHAFTGEERGYLAALAGISSLALLSRD
jgi:GAF domain-containing protein